MPFSARGWGSIMSDEFVESLRRSKRERAKIVARLGCVPMSVLRLSRGALSRRMFSLQKERPHGSVQVDLPPEKIATMSEAAKEKYRICKERGLMGRGVAGAPNIDRVQVSIMPAELVQFFVRYYAEAGAVYVDPFLGQGVQMQVAALEGLDYYAVDVCQEYVDYAGAVIDRLDLREGQTVQVVREDARVMDSVPDGIGDICFTSPPYWDIEYYDDSDEQLGHGKGYDEFLEGMGEVAKALRSKMKPGAYAVVNVNDFRRNGRFYGYSIDTVNLFRAAGWTHHDTWIIDGLVGGISRAFAVDRCKQKIAPKVHEYAWVFRA